MRILSLRSPMTVLTVLVALLASACTESTRPEATGKGTVRGINAIVTAPEVAFLAEERRLGSANYKEVVGFQEWDDLSYNFNFDLLLPGATEFTRIAGEFIDVARDTEYTLALTGTLDNPTILVWEAPERDWEAGETVFEADFVHLSPLLGQADVYYLPDGTQPAVGNEVGTLNFGDRVPYAAFEEGDYVLTLTAPGDPGTVLFQSTALPRSPAERVTIAVYDGDPSITSNVAPAVVFSGGSAQAMADINSPPQVRALHAAFGTQNFDGFFNEDFSSPVFPDIEFRELSLYADLAEIVTPLTLTAVGDTATTIFESDIQFVTNIRRTFFLWGQPGDLRGRTLTHDARPLSTFPVVRITHFSTNVEIIDIYDVESGTVIDETVAPKFSSAIPGISTSFFDTRVGMRDFVLTLNGEKTPIATPVTLDLANGDVVDMIIIDTADPAAVELLVFETIP